MSPACAAPQRRQLKPVMIDGAVGENEALLGDNAMIESVKPSNATAAAQVQPPAPPQPTIPISVRIFSSSPGPKNCRGSVIMNLNLPKAPLQTTPTCVNMPGVAECAVFAANREDGCQARVFDEPDCKTFVNLAVFTPENRAFGGWFRSMEVTCGIKSVQPAPLSLGDLGRKTSGL